MDFRQDVSKDERDADSPSPWKTTLLRAEFSRYPISAGTSASKAGLTGLHVSAHLSNPRCLSGPHPPPVRRVICVKITNSRPVDLRREQLPQHCSPIFFNRQTGRKRRGKSICDLRCERAFCAVLGANHGHAPSSCCSSSLSNRMAPLIPGPAFPLH